MPNRILREGILTSERVAALSRDAELFYRRLMSVVDDYGRMEAHPSIIRAKCYPLALDSVTDDDVSLWLSDVSQMSDMMTVTMTDNGILPLVSVYTVKGKRYLQINDFRQRTRTESKCPPPCQTNGRHDDGQMTVTCQTNARLGGGGGGGGGGDGGSFDFEKWVARLIRDHPNPRDARLGISHLSEKSWLRDASERNRFTEEHHEWCEHWRSDHNGKFAPKFPAFVLDYETSYRGRSPNESECYDLPKYSDQ